MNLDDQLRTALARMVIACSKPAETITIGGMPMEIRQCDSVFCVNAIIVPKLSAEADAPIKCPK